MTCPICESSYRKCACDDETKARYYQRELEKIEDVQTEFYFFKERAIKLVVNLINDKRYSRLVS